MPRLTVLMPVLNSAANLQEAVSSVLSQSFKDFELLVIDGGSTDNTLEILNSFQDPRIKILENREGLSQSLNAGLDASSSEYIARMDADDISVHNRFSNQIRYMDFHQDVVVCGSWFRTLGDPPRVHRHPETHKEIFNEFLFTGCVIGHPTVIIRRKKFLEAGGRYNGNLKSGEDFELWARLSDKVKFANIPEVLLLYRLHSLQASSTQGVKLGRVTRDIQAQLLLRTLRKHSANDLDTAYKLLSGEYEVTPKFTSDSRKLITRLMKANKRSQRYDHEKFVIFFSEIWDSISRQAISKYGTSAALQRIFSGIPVKDQSPVFEAWSSSLRDSKTRTMIYIREKARRLRGEKKP